MILRVNPDVLTWICKRPGTKTTGTPLPRDAKVVNRWIDVRGDIVLLVESAEYDEVPEHLIPPEMSGPTFESPDRYPPVASDARRLIVQAIVRLEQFGDIDLAIRLADAFEVKCGEEDAAKIAEVERQREPLMIARNLTARSISIAFDEPARDMGEPHAI